MWSRSGLWQAGDHPTNLREVHVMKKSFLVLLFAGIFTCTAGRADWPMVRGNAARGGYAAEGPAKDLSLRWLRKAGGVPQPAWPRSGRLRDDRAYHVVAAGGRVFFGSSADCHVYALDAATGREVWSFATGAPVRFAPAMWKGPAGWRLFAASDDGILYCLDAATGKMLWCKRGGPDGRMLLGNGRMISRRPARGGPVVADGVVYFGAGIWPSEGVWIYALNAADGEVIWCNSQAGGLTMPQPHGGAVAKSGITAQGYLVAAGEQLFVPTGRAVPAALDRKTGKLRYFHLQRYGQLGGSAMATMGAYMLNGRTAFNARTGAAAFSSVSAAAMAHTPSGTVVYALGAVGALDAAKPTKTIQVARRGRKVNTRVPNVTWSVKTDVGGSTLIVAGGTIVSGGAGKVAAIDAATRQVTWSADVDGEALGLAVADGQLYVSTDSGAIYCFGAAKAGPKTVAPRREADPYGENAVAVAAARAILEKTGVREGYCVDLACGDGALAYELARQSKLRVYAVDSDPAAVAAARRKLRAAGLYGLRVTVHLADPARTPYPDYFADLAVSGRSMRKDAAATPSAEMARLLRPGGGVGCVGPAGQMKQTVRPPLAGAGKWTHQYADAANTICGSDRVVRAPLGLLWFDCPDIRLPNRHGRAPAPLSDGSRMFVLGLDALRALDIYNGRVLWEYPLTGPLKPLHQDHLMGTAGTGSNLCLGAGRAYVHNGTDCLVIDTATGKKVAGHAAPKLPNGKPGRWGYIAVLNGKAGPTGGGPTDSGTLLGTLVDESHLVPYRFLRSNMAGMFTESRVLFAMDPATGKVRWRYVADKSIRHNAIAVSGGRVYLIDRTKAAETPGGARLKTPQPPGVLVALDLTTGGVAWKNEKDIYGTMLAAGEDHDVLLMCYQSTRFKLNSEVGGRMTGMRASTGKRLWDIQAKYASRPLIAGRTIYAHVGAWDLVTGKQKMTASDPPAPWTFKRSYGCGIISATTKLLLFRSATLGYRDLVDDRETVDFGGIRPGCWINVIAAGGLVLMPDATTGCKCSYLNSATIALQPIAAKPAAKAGNTP